MASRSTHELYALYAGVLAAKALGGSADSDITGDISSDEDDSDEELALEECDASFEWMWTPVAPRFTHNVDELQGNNYEISPYPAYLIYYAALNALCRLVPDKYNAAQWRDTWKNHPQWWTPPGTEEISAQIAYDNAVLVTHVQPHNLYSEFMEHLQKQRAQLPNLKNSSLCQILTRTLEVRDYEKIQRDYIYDRVPIKSRKKGKEQRDKQQHQRTTYNLSGEEAFPSDACLECFRLPPEKRCRQKIYVSDQNAEFLRGCGVTRAPEAARMKPGKSPKSRSNKHPPPIFTPEDIQSRGCKFVGYERDEEVMQRCGMQIRFICYASTDELIDVVVYGAFHPEIMKRFKEHSDAPSECKPLTRGGQFDFYSSEKGMTAYGSIVPKGGLPGSGYAPVAGFNTRTSAGIDLVFNEVEVISPVIYYYYSMLIPSADLMAKTEAADRMGKAGLNTYRCDGYYAAQHEDEDACRGIHPTVITCKRIQTRFGRSTEAECMGQCCLQSHRLIKRLYYGCAGAHAVDVALTTQ
ncbi:hypothetical protein B0H12DRAFT_1235405 [Mycena haematopus]|nr:hypothetical protein B0H12DRAFT_1235405 [Mycena haematopus]